MFKKLRVSVRHSDHIKDLVLLFSVPLVIVIITAGVVYIPMLFTNPKYSFVYTECTTYNCDDTYYVDTAGGISIHTLQTVGFPGGMQPLTLGGEKSKVRSDYIIADPVAKVNPPVLHYYDVNTDSSRPLTFSQAQQYSLDPSSKSPDGYKLQQHNSSGGFLFWDSNDYGWYLEKGSRNKKIDISNSAYYDNNITLLGWVKK